MTVGRAFITKKNILCGGFSVIFSLALMIGFHLHIEAIYTGSYMENYFIPFKWWEIFLIPLLIAIIFAFARFLVSFKPFRFHVEDRLPVKGIIIVASILFLCYLPWLYAYFPGFIFGDTEDSIRQALGLERYINHHPILYSKFLESCMSIGRNLFCSNAIGLGISTFFQMVFMSLGNAYLLQWMITRFHLPKYSYAAGILIYGVSQYIASYSIAMWKDTVFSVAIVLLSLILTDCVVKEQAGAIQKTMLVLLTFFVIFTRNNGIYVIAGALILFCVAQIRSGSCFMRRIAAVGTSIVVVGFLILHPVYDYYHLNEDDLVEKYGVLINQMARAATYDEDISPADREYLNELFPIYRYWDTYTPCCIDLLKWDDEFNKNALNDSFFQHWWSLFLTNKGRYIQSWILTTGGFWLPYTQVLLKYDNNINGGSILNLDFDTSEKLENIYQIQRIQLPGSQSLRNYLNYSKKSIPIGSIVWLLLLLFCSLIIQKDSSRLIITLLGLCLVLTLAVASPIFYWPRYGFALQLLGPVYCLMLLSRREDIVPRQATIARRGYVFRPSQDIVYRANTDRD